MNDRKLTGVIQARPTDFLARAQPSRNKPSFGVSVCLVQAFMHAGAHEGDVIVLFQLGKDVVGVKDGILGNLTEPIRAMRHHVGERTNVHAELAGKAFDPSAGAGTLPLTL